MIFLLMNIAILLGSVYLLFSAMLGYALILALPVPLIIVFVVGIITPVLNIYDTIRNLIILTESSKDEDSM